MKKLFAFLLFILVFACNLKFVDPVLTEKSAIIKGRVVPSAAAVFYVREGDTTVADLDSSTGEFELQLVPGNGEFTATAAGFGRFRSLRYAEKGETELGTIWLPLEPFPINEIVRGGGSDPFLFFVRFIEPMDTESQAAVTTSPAINGRFVWSDDHRTLFFYRHSTEFQEGSFQVHIDGTAKTRQGESIEFAYSKNFSIPVLYVTNSSPLSGQRNFPAASEISVRFSEEILDSSVDGFIFSRPSQNLSIRVSGSTIYAKPASGHWPFGVACTLLVAQGLRTVGGNLLEDTVRLAFQTERAAVASVTPSPAAAGVDIGTSIRVVFPEAMDQGSTEQAFLIADSLGTAMNGTFSWTPFSTGFAFTPNTSLSPAAMYTIAFDTSAELDNGSHLQAFRSLFATAPALPLFRIDSVFPGANSRLSLLGSGFQISTTQILDKLTVVPALSVTPDIPCSYSVVNNDRVIQILPVSGFWPADSAFTITLAPGSILDVNGHSLSAMDSVYSFSTSPVTVVDHFPLNGSNPVSRTSPVTLTFNTAMDTSTANAAIAVWDSANNPEPGTRVWSAGFTKVTLQHASGDSFSVEMPYEVVVDTTASDLYGKKLPERFTARFTTGAD